VLLVATDTAEKFALKTVVTRLPQFIGAHSAVPRATTYFSPSARIAIPRAAEGDLLTHVPTAEAGAGDTLVMASGSARATTRTIRHIFFMEKNYNIFVIFFSFV
jgi:hypothetical protein